MVNDLSGPLKCGSHPALPVSRRVPRIGLLVRRGHQKLNFVTCGRVTASIGVATGTIDSIAAFEAIHASADETMYAAKRNGGNRIAVAGAVDGRYGIDHEGEIPFRPMAFDEGSELGAESLGR